MTTMRGAIRPRTIPGELTPATANGAGYDTAYASLQAQVPDTHLLLYVLVD
ncbi:MAG: hypothetical protein LBE05_04260 [Microbacterium sp.]|jgi:hypothetical protein|nr:hypothetical protein [Microbacterium sp.]